jgi:perosamine synthetase
MRRYLSLYYGSIDWVDALKGWGSACNPRNTASRLRAGLQAAIRPVYGTRSAFAFGSGRGALAACLQAADIGPGAEVVLSSYTCLAVATAVVSVGATPVYVDIDPSTLNVAAADVIAALSSRTRAVVVQHTLGQSAPIEAIAEAARARGVLVIEDCALALGSTRGGAPVGTLGDAAIFSMELSKVLSSGWGGILLVSDPALTARVAGVYATVPEQSWVSSTRDAWQIAMSAWCHRPEASAATRRWILRLGFKSRLFRPSTPVAEFDGAVSASFVRKMGRAQVALATTQWARLESVASTCARHAREVRRTLDGLGLAVPGAPEAPDVSVTPRVSFLVSDRDQAVAYFAARGIELGQWFSGPLSPVPRAPSFNYRPRAYPRAERIARTVVNLPSHSGLSDGDVVWIQRVVAEFVRDHPGSVIYASGLAQGRKKNRSAPIVDR